MKLWSKIMVEINQVVPNLISESISWKNQDGALRRQIYQSCDAGLSLMRNVISWSNFITFSDLNGWDRHTFIFIFPDKNPNKMK